MRGVALCLLALLASAISAALPAPSSTVVVLDGAAERVRHDTLASIARHLITPLRARAIAVWQGSPGAVDVAEVKRLYGIDAVVEPDAEPEDFITVAVPGLDGSMLRTVFFNAYTKFRAYSGLRGLDFDWMVYTRSDMEWFARLPPRLLWKNFTDLVWVPDSEDWGGVYDRAAIVPRRFAKVYLQGAFQALIGPAVKMALRFGEATVSSEKLLYKVLEEAGAKFGGFPPLGAIRRCTKKIPACQLHTYAEEVYGKKDVWRYFHEYVDAMHAAEYSSCPASWWKLTLGRRDINPGCWNETGGLSKSKCCISTSAEDEVDCFESPHSGHFYSKRRCCGFLPYITLKVPGDATCWSLSSPESLLWQIKTGASLEGSSPIACLP